MTAKSQGPGTRDQGPGLGASIRRPINLRAAKSYILVVVSFRQAALMSFRALERAYLLTYSLAHLLTYLGAPDELPGVRDDRFETPHDAALVRVPIVDGDVVVLATDGRVKGEGEGCGCGCG